MAANLNAYHFNTTVTASANAVTLTFADAVTVALPTITLPSGMTFNAIPDQLIDTYLGYLRSEGLAPPPPEVLQRARRLLEGILPPEAVLSWDRDGYFDIPSRAHRGRVYRILRRDRLVTEPWIDVYQDGAKYAGVCLHVTETHWLVDDAVVAKYLLCRYAEEEVETVGNWNYVHHDLDYTRPPVVVEIPS